MVTAISGSFTLGVDLGQARSYSAVVLLAHERAPDPIYTLVHAQRFPLGTSFSEIVDRIAAPLAAPPLLGRTTVAVDAGGIGAPVLEQLRPRLPRGTSCRAIELTAGSSVHTAKGKTTVPKSDLIATTQILFQNRRTRIAAGSPAADELAEELRSYTITINENGHPTYRPAQDGGHDDLVLALGLAAWTAEHTRGGTTFTIHVPRGEIPLLSDDTRRAMGS
jgi:hypothetical protein